ncbi:MAG: division/cell wall cluster transcriptional repressor MraZ [Lachnospiraceae bacterium]|nr:division/cell wall cluster transcriptional repressor MraZ [Lachnospiraceae bacterium]SCY30464.1 MraZ protein [Lachnospiraceae bacterium XPB1003]
MFKSDFSHSIDDKGRVIIPAKFRDELGEGFVITKGVKRCLWVLDAESWHTLAGKLRSISAITEEGHKLLMHFCAAAVDGETDKQGRVFLPPTLREYANLSKEAVICGMDNRLEIWSKEAYEEQLKASDDLTPLIGNPSIAEIVTF